MTWGEKLGDEALNLNTLRERLEISANFEWGYERSAAQFSADAASDASRAVSSDDALVEPRPRGPGIDALTDTSSLSVMQRLRLIRSVVRAFDQASTGSDSRFGKRLSSLYTVRFKYISDLEGRSRVPTHYYSREHVSCGVPRPVSQNTRRRRGRRALATRPRRRIARGSWRSSRCIRSPSSSKPSPCWTATATASSASKNSPTSCAPSAARLAHAEFSFFLFLFLLFFFFFFFSFFFFFLLLFSSGFNLPTAGRPKRTCAP